MLLALLTIQSAFACGPYGGFAASDDASVAYEEGDAIAVYSHDGGRLELPIYGEVTDFDFVGEELVVAYLSKGDSFAVLFDEDGEEVAEWAPRRPGQVIRNITVLPDSLLVHVASDERRMQVRLTDDLRLVAPRMVSAGGF